MAEVIKLSEMKGGISGIYKINFPNGKCYIGQSIDIRRRMWEHNNPNNTQANGKRGLCDQAIDKYGKIEFIEILEYVNDTDEIDDRERYWIAFYNSDNREKGYNLTPGGVQLHGEEHPSAILSDEEVIEIRKRRYNGERKINVYQDYKNKITFNGFEKIWLGANRCNVGKEYIIRPGSISRQEYSSRANSGENNNKAKLKEKDVLEIRKRFDNGETPAEINKDYPWVSRQTISRVCNRITWKNI